VSDVLNVRSVSYVVVHYLQWKICTSSYPCLQSMTSRDIDILLDRLGTTLGINGTALTWLRSFINDRKQQVFFNGDLSSTVCVTTGVPQGRVLGPLLFLLYSADVPFIADLHGLGVHCYADDGQIYVLTRPGRPTEWSLKCQAALKKLTHG